MRKTITAALLAIAATPVYAGDYEFAQTKIQMCRIIGGVSTDAFAEKQANKPVTRIAGFRGQPLQTLVTFAEDYGYNTATDNKDAHMTAWAKCMDNIEWLTRMAQRGEGPPAKLLY